MTQTWQDILGEEKQKAYFRNILDFLNGEREKGKIIYPPPSKVFNALKLTPFDKLKVVILGQDPYHGPKQAHGLSFSVQAGIKPPPSLQNIYKELSDDVDFQIPAHGCLEKWAKQGVLLLNASLTVEARRPQSHGNIGWEQFTDRIIELISHYKQGVVFLLWGAFAQKKAELIDQNKHFILRAPHPSPFSANRGFFGCKHFSKANAILKEQGKTPIDWQL